MRHYGVRRLVVINSGNYLYADIDLSKPVHLAAPNNRGKSTLVNALQFLYVDDISRMKFGRRSLDDSKRHYFGEERSYLIYECQTPSGIQCLLVRGLSNLRGALFERYVYDGEFRDGDYLDEDEDREIRAFDSVRSQLADRHLAQVKKSELWQVLAGNLPAGEGKATPRLNILPIRRHDEYIAFRDVFVRLLSLSNADASTLRQLIIDAHAREIAERRIDVAAEYKDAFERAERSEQEVLFIRSVLNVIDEGHTLRQGNRALIDKLKVGLPTVWGDAARCRGFADAEVQRLTLEQDRLAREQGEAEKRKEAALTTRGEKRAALRLVEQEQDILNASHEKWSAYSPEFIKEMRGNLRDNGRQIAEIESNLTQAATLDLDAMRRQSDNLKRQIATDKKAFAQWENTAAAELRRAGLSKSQMDAAFRIANPSLLKLIVGDTLTIKDADLVVARVRDLATRVKQGQYSDDAIIAEVSSVAGPDAQMLEDPTEFQKHIALNEQDLATQNARLRVAQDQNSAKQRLEKLKRDDVEQRRSLDEYENYVRAWSKRAELTARLADAKEAVRRVEGECADFELQVKGSGKAAKEIESDLTSLGQRNLDLSKTVRDLRSQSDRLGLVIEWPDSTVRDDEERPQSLSRSVASVITKANRLGNDANSLEANRQKLTTLEATISDKSQDHDSQQRYFSDADEEWTLLIASRESLAERETANAKNWDALSTTLGARFNSIVTAVRGIKNAVERINRGLKSYQVSNLRCVEIKVEEEHDIYPVVEALAGADSLFHNRESIDTAKRRLRRMIEANEVIDVQSLFELRINIQETDETWHQAPSLDEIGSTGTGMMAKAMIFFQLLRAIAENEKYKVHFYIDGLGELDDRNLTAMTSMAVSKGIIPITADPRLHLEPLAHPEVTVYSLGQSEEDGHFYVDSHRTYHVRRVEALNSTAQESSE